MRPSRRATTADGHPMRGIALSRLWPVAAVLAPVVVLTAAPLATVDLTYHLRTGALILDSHGLARADAYTFTAKGLPWLDQQWGAQVVLEELFRLGGWLALAVARSLLAAFALLLVYLASRARGAEARTAACLTFGTGFLTLANLPLRPQLFGIACFTSTMWLLADRYRHPARIWLVIPVTIIWANLHGTFFLAPVLVGLAWFEDLAAHRQGARRLPALAGAVAAASLVNPFGVHAWSYVAQLTTNPVVRKTIVEWQPPTIGSYVGAAFFVSVAIVAVLLARAPEPPSWSAMLSLAIFFAIGLTSVRGVYWWAFAAPVILAGTGAMGSRGSERPDPVNGLNTVLAASLVLVLALATVRWLPYGSEAPPPEGLLSYAPLGITEELHRILEPGQRFFDAQLYGSWFEYALPDNPLAVDSRIEVIPESEWTRYDDVSNGREGWQRILDDWGVTVAVLGPEQQKELIPRMLADPGWQLVYRDPDGLIFTRRPPA